MTDGNAQPGAIKKGIVKQVLSGDAIVLLGPPSHNGPPKETTVYLANIAAPRIAKRPNESGSGGSNDEPFAWEAREFIRKKIVGQSVVFVRDFIAASGREHGRVYLGGTSIENAESIAESGVSEGWLEVRPGKVVDELTQKLLDLQEKAKAAKKGKWGVSESDYSKHVRDVKWNIPDTKALVEKYHQKPVKAVIEQIRDGSTVRGFLLPSFEYVTINLSGIKCPSPKTPSQNAEPFGEEARFFVEQRILQRDVEVVLESTSNNQTFLGSVIHPKGNIAVFLLKDGYAKTNWSITLSTAGVQALKEAEKSAQEGKLRIWRNYTAASTANRKSFEGTVVEVGLGDSLVVEKDDGETVKLYLSSIRPPRKEGEAPNPAAGARKFLPLYDIPFMFEAREFLRKTLVGKKAKVTIDYIQPKSEQYPEKVCATVTVGGNNVGVQLVEKGLAKVIHHKQDDENRSSAYDDLFIAESNAEKEKRGLFSGKKSNVRVQEIQGDVSRANQFIGYLKKSSRNEGIVEFLSSGSRLRVYIPKETVIITFLLGGISCPKGPRIGPGGKPIGEGEPFADEALKFTRKYTFQKEVKVEVETTDKNGAFIGYMFVQKENGSWGNLSEMLVENGLASVHFSAEKSSYFNGLSTAEKFAKEGKRGIWKNHVEEENKNTENEQVAETTERKVNYKKVVVSEVVPGSLRFYAQYFDDGDTIVRLMKDLQEISSATEGTVRPKKNDLVAVRFSDRYHRAKVEAIKGDNVDVFYLDYGNREQVDVKQVAPLPPHFQARPQLAHEYVLALTTVPAAEYYAQDASATFAEFVFSQASLLLNPEYKVGNIDAASLVTDDGKKKDVGRFLISEGFALIERRREKRLLPLVEQYTEAENEARQGPVAVIVYLVWKHLEHRRRFSGVPSPRSYPFIGHLMVIKPDVQGFVDQVMGMANVYPEEGIVLFWAGPFPLLMIFGPEYLEPIFTNSKHFNKPFLYDMMVPWLGYGLLTSPVEKWRGRRKLLTPTFHYDILKNFVFVFNKQAEILVQQLKKAVESGEKSIEISKYVTLCALDIICETSMGKCNNAQYEADSDYVKAVYKINDIIQKRQKNPIFWPNLTFYLFGDGKDHDWALNVLHNFRKNVIKERKEEMKNEKFDPTERLAFLDMLLTMEERGEISTEDVEQEVDTFMFEGHDTTASAINWAIHLLGNHPEEQEKALKEIEQVVGDSSEVTFDHLGKLKYLECIIKESLRLQPSVPMFARVLGEDQKFEQFTIPKGTQVVINPYCIHRDPLHWEDPDVFNPERFLPENSRGRHAFAFVPFSAGSRNCIGQRFALMEEKTVLTNVLRNFKILSSKRRDQLGFKTELILRPIGGVHVCLSPRSGA